MSNCNVLTPYGGIERRDLRLEPRTLKQEMPRRRRGDRTTGRHAAITSKILNWSSYRNWAYKVRGNWEDGSKP